MKQMLKIDGVVSGRTPYAGSMDTDYPFTFDQDAALAAVLYVAERVPGVTTHKLSKILYFAEKAHLERYGRLITGDQFVAMENGPVPSQIYSMLGQVDPKRGPPGLFASPLTDALSIRREGNRPIITALRPADLDALSDSDIECLNAAIRDYAPVARFDELSDLSHDAAWHATPRNQKMRIETIISTLENAELLLAHVRDSHP